MKKINLLILLLVLTFSSTVFSNQPPAKGYNPHYRFLHSNSLVADKNFYLLTAIDQDKDVSALLSADAVLKEMLSERIAVIKKHVTDTCQMPGSLLIDFKWNRKDSTAIIRRLDELYQKNTKAFDQLINHHLRPSGYYQCFQQLSNKELYLRAWNQYFYGINYIIDQFGLGKKMRYPLIDSPNYVVTSKYYKTVLKDIFASLNEVTTHMRRFEQPSLSVALQLLQANDRDEPARFEPMESGENKAAIAKIRSINWKRYPYATIVIPGNGPRLTTTPISPDNKIHCDVAARRYLAGKAPFIIVSGGYCYPFRGPYCEAIEMRRYLMHTYAIKANAIIIDPHARHTTTNIRNADRLMIRYGIPINKPSLFITSKSQHDYSMNVAFDKRNQKELGYIPYTGKKSLSDHDIEFYPVIESLHMDPFDPLDP